MVQCLLSAVPPLGLSTQVVKLFVLGAGDLGAGVCSAAGFLLPVLSALVAAVLQVFPPIPMKPIYSFHKQIRTKRLLIPSEEKPCPAYIAPMKSKWGEM